MVVRHGRHRPSLALALIYCSAILVAGISFFGCRPTARDGTVRLLLSMKGPGGGNPFWAEVERGARAAAESSGVVLTVLAPPSESDVATQIAQIEDQIARRVSAILVAPTDVAGLNPTFDRAKELGIPVIFVDTDASWPDKSTFVGTDNVQGGRLAGQFLCDSLQRGAKVALITGVMTHQTHIDRIRGAKDALDGCGAVIVAEQAANSDRALAQSVAEDILTGHPDLQGIFAGADLMILGALEAAKARSRADEVVMVGFDAIPEAVEQVEVGLLAATVAQNPFRMGKLAVASAVTSLAGQELPPVIDTGTELVVRHE